MKPIRQLLRQPMKTISGVMLIVLAVAILCLGFGQLIIATSYEALMGDVFTTIAVPSFAYSDENYNGDTGAEAVRAPEVTQTIRQMIEENPDVILGAAAPGLASAYIPDLTMDYYYQYDSVFSEFASTYYRTFCSDVYAPSCAMFEVTITGQEEPIPVEMNGGDIMYLCQWYGVIESAPGIGEGFGDLTGVQADVVYWVNRDSTGIESVDQFGLEIGQRYLMYTANFNAENLMQEDGQVRSCQISFRAYDNITGNLEVENIENYALPMCVKLDGTVAEFLASEEGRIWQEALDRIAVNNYAFPVIGVDNLNHIPDFNTNYATVTTGRDFTEDERATGANVCIISETVAKASGLSIGDQITIRYYEHDENGIYRNTLEDGMGVINPLAEDFTPMTPFVDDGITYTIVGLYTQKDAWSNLSDNLYAFTPNTVFVPKGSVTVEMQYSDQGMFGVLELYDGTVEEFYRILDKTGYRYLFECYDQGYTVIKENVDIFIELSKQVAVIGLAVYGVILLLYLVIFPAQQGSALGLMNAMGTTLLEKLAHILFTGLGMLLPGTALGVLGAALLWDNMIGLMTGIVAAKMELQLDVSVLVAIGGMQLAAALLLTVLVSVPLLLRNAMKRK